MVFGLDLREMFAPDVNLLEIFLRGTIIYLGLFALMRILLHRKTANVSMTELLVLVLIADASQNAMAAGYNSVTAGVVLATTLIGWSFALDWLGYHFPVIERFIHPPKKALVVDGRVLRKALAEELMTEEELMTQLRLHGEEKVENVRAAYLEGNGEISVLLFEGRPQDAASSSLAAV